MLVTDEIFEAFLKCETKSFLKYSEAGESQGEFINWQHHLVEEYKQKCRIQLRSRFREDQYFLGTLHPLELANKDYRLVIGCEVEAQGFQSNIHALELLASSRRRKYSPYIPIRFIPDERITKHHRLILAFDAFVWSKVYGKMPLFGKIIHGKEQKVAKVKLLGLIEVVKTLADKITAQQISQTPPQLIIIKHCAECEFKEQCRQAAIEKDELTLLSRMTTKERSKLHNRGIFSITQLSYTFRPRRKPRRSFSTRDRYSHAIKALAIREKKIHIAGKPELI